MKIVIRKALFTALLATVAFPACLGADTLLGLWRSGTGHDNSIEYYTTVEFLTNGLCHKSEVMKNPSGKVVTVPLNGTFKIIDTNHIEIELVYNPMVSAKMKFDLGYALSNNILYLQSFDETGSVNKYERVKNP